MHSKALPPTGVRMPAPLRERLKEMAETNKRSLNAEIVYHLERVAFDPLPINLEAGGNATRGAA